MDSSVVLPASDASSSNGFSPSSASALFGPTSTLSVQSSFDDVHTDHTGPRPTSPGTSSTGPDQAVVSQSPAVVGLRLPSEDSGSMASTNDGRAQLRSDRQRAAWYEMHERMELRRREWNAQVDRMRTDFFKLKPPTSLTADAGQSSAVVTADLRQQRVIDVGPSWEPSTITRQQFQVH